VCAKNDLHLARVIAFFKALMRRPYPTLVFDDEADAPPGYYHSSEDGGPRERAAIP